MTTESVTYSGYVFYEEHKSLLGLDTTITEEAGFFCPKCREQMPPLEHGAISRCSNCQLWFQKWGNSLECSDVKPVSMMQPSPIGRSQSLIQKLFRLKGRL